MLTLGSLFDGLGVFPLTASRHGITPLWASEIEKAPISITKRHFPGMAHLGDVTKLHGGKIPPVDVLTFGSPCQNLSQIGNRKGLGGEQSSLFYEAIRIINQMKPIGKMSIGKMEGSGESFQQKAMQSPSPWVQHIQNSRASLF